MSDYWYTRESPDLSRHNDYEEHVTLERAERRIRGQSPAYPNTPPVQRPSRAMRGRRDSEMSAVSFSFSSPGTPRSRYDTPATSSSFIDHSSFDFDQRTPPTRPVARRLTYHQSTSAISNLTDPFQSPASREGSIHSVSSAQHYKSGISSDSAYRFMSLNLLKMAHTRQWASAHPDDVSAVAIRMAKNSYATSPRNDPRLEAFERSINILNSEVIFTMTSDSVRTITAGLEPGQQMVYLSAQQQIQVVENYDELADARVAQMACFVRGEGSCVVWCDRVDDFPVTVEKWEDKFTKYVWKQATADPQKSGHASDVRLPGLGIDGNSIHESYDEKEDPEAGLEKPRPTLYYASVYTGLAVGLNIFACTLFTRNIVHQVLLDGNFVRLGLLAVLPFLFLCIMFVCDTIICAIAQVIMPIGQMSRNSLYYSAVPPRQLQGVGLPHITVLMPVYKEGLDKVLAPSIESVSKAIRNYTLQGGTANILVCEDGLQTLDDEKEVLKRRDFYERWNCAWVARHPDNRAGRFKKSSNMNKTMRLSLRVEELMDSRRPTNLPWGSRQEEDLYDDCLQMALGEHQGEVWAEGNIRIGDLILLIDSDTRIPEDCFLDAASEMESSPEVGILQHCSGTFLAGAGYFENGIAFLTKMVNFSITWSVANGATAPFVGHNAFLRWSALQHQAFYNENGNIWSENHVSEDFVMTLNLTRIGYIVRWATYAKLGFLEGVSLTITDELNRWQKYAYGCSEMVFNPMVRWVTRTPFSKLYAQFLWCPAPLVSKFTTSSYVASYWAIGVGTPLCIALYIVQGLFWDFIDLTAFSLPFATLIGCIIFFTIGGTVGLIVARYRSQDADLLTCLVQHIGWTPFLVFFFGGLSWHVFTALLAHITSYPLTWSATVKEVGETTVFKEVGILLRKFKITYAVMFALLAGVVVLTTNVVPLQWQVHEFVIMFPAIWFASLHILLPIVLNPSIMLFRF